MELQQPGLPITLSTLVTPLVLVANESLASMRRDGPGSDGAFHFSLCLKLMRRMVSPYPLMRFLMLGLQQVAVRQVVALPTEATDLVDSIRREKSGSLPVIVCIPCITTS